MQPRGHPGADLLNVDLLAVAIEIGDVRLANMALVESGPFHRDGLLEDRVRQARDEPVVRAEAESSWVVMPQDIAEPGTEAIGERDARLGRSPPIVETAQRVPDAGDATDCQFDTTRIENLEPGF